MQDDALDKILKDAAGQYHPAYNDKAWEGMHVKLNKHLPQKEYDRKWPWLLLPLLVTFVAAGIVWLGSGKNDEPVVVKGNEAATATAKNETVQSDEAAVRQAGVVSTGTAPQLINNTIGTPGLASSNVPNGVTVPSATVLPLGRGNEENAQKRSSFRTRTSIKPGQAVDDLNELDRAAPPPQTAASTVAGDKTASESNTVTGVLTTPVISPVNTVAEKKIEQAANKITAVTGENKLPEPGKETGSAKTGQKKQQRSSFGGNIALTISAGPDYSFVKTSQPGEVQLAYGAGIAYTFAKRFTIRAGAYAAKKVYTTDSADYNPDIPLSTYYSNIQKIKGNCLVYEVPLSLSYDFAGKNNHSWFGNAGISSFFMKRETYTYYYKRNGTDVSREYTINDQNNHLLSVLTLSAGYRYRMNQHISLAAEPYFKLPLGGVGMGNIRLNSAGVLFSAIVRPFSKK